MRRADLMVHLRDYRAFVRIMRWAGALWLAVLAILIPFAIYRAKKRIRRLRAGEAAGISPSPVGA